jgi:hypothetical protein
VLSTVIKVEYANKIKIKKINFPIKPYTEKKNLRSVEFNFFVGFVFTKKEFNLV